MKKTILIITIFLSSSNFLQASIIYVNKSYGLGSANQYVWPATREFDINEDGINDIYLGVNTTSSGNNISLQSQGKGLGSNQIIMLDAGETVGPSTSFWPANVIQNLGVEISGSICFMQPPTCYQPGWPNVSKSYVGIKFYINDQIHYGWAVLNTRPLSSMGINENWAGLLGFAYEDQPNTSVITSALVQTSIEESYSFHSSIFPNPAKEELMIYSDKAIDQLVIYNSAGSKVLDQPGNPDNTFLLKNLPSGLYWVEIRSGNKTSRKSIIKE